MKEPEPPPIVQEEVEEFFGMMLEALTHCLKTLSEDQRTPRGVITNGKHLIFPIPITFMLNIFNIIRHKPDLGNRGVPCFPGSA